MITPVRFALIALPLSVCSIALAGPGSIDAGTARANLPPHPAGQLPLTTASPPALGTPSIEKIQAGDSSRIPFVAMKIENYESEIPQDSIAPPLLAPWLGKSISTSQWKTISNQLWEAYRSAGLLVRVDLLLNANGAGTVRISKLRVHSLNVKGAPGVSPEATHRFEMIAKEKIVAGTPVDLPGMEALIRQFYYRNAEIPRLDMRSFDAASVDIDLTLQPAPTPAVPFPWTVTTDSYGLNAFGRGRISAGYRMSPLGNGDLFSANALVSEGLQAADLRYELPAPAMLPLRFAIDYNYLDYHVQNAPPEAGQDGYAQTARVEASYPQFFWGGGMLTHTLSFDEERAADYVSEINTNLKTLDNLRYRLLGLNFFEGHANGWLELTHGHVALGGLVAPADNENTQEAGVFTKAAAEASWHQPFNNWLALDTRVRGQIADKNLDSLEEFTLGGATSVRAYDSDQGRGDQGMLVSLDLWATPSSTQPVRVGVFSDWGAVQVNYHSWPGAGPNRYSLNSGGVELSYGYQALSLLLSAAHSLTQSSVEKNVGWRLWAEASLHF
jgi:hemolysin activation/secretion protein